MARYIDATNGDTFGDKVAHYDRDCDELDGRGRPIAESTVDAAEMDTCEACSPLGRASDDGTAVSDETDAAPSDGDESPDELSREDLISVGRCPWCVEEDADDPYRGDHVGQHASSAHPDAWSEYKA